MKMGSIATTESGRSGAVLAMRSGPDGLHVKIGSLASDWERVASLKSAEAPEGGEAPISEEQPVSEEQPAPQPSAGSSEQGKGARRQQTRVAAPPTF